MGAVKISIYGPANGFVAYTIPRGISNHDDSLALSSAEASLSNDSSAMKYSRITGEDGSLMIRAAMFRQVFEPNLRRRGHTYGAAIDFHETITTPAICIEVLDALCETIRELCVSDGTFCGPARFHEFVMIDAPSRLGPNFEKVFSELSRDSIKMPKLETDAPSLKGTLFYLMTSADQRFEAKMLYEWFLFGASSNSWPRLLCSADREISLGPFIKLVGSPFRSDYELLSPLYSANKEFLRKKLDQSALIKSKDDTIEALESKIATDFRDAEIQNKQAFSSSSKNKNSASKYAEKSLSRADLEEIKKLFEASLTRLMNTEYTRVAREVNAPTVIDTTETSQITGLHDHNNIIEKIILRTLLASFALVFCILIVLVSIKFSGI